MENMVKLISLLTEAEGIIIREPWLKISKESLTDSSTLHNVQVVLALSVSIEHHVADAFQKFNKLRDLDQGKIFKNG